MPRHPSPDTLTDFKFHGLLQPVHPLAEFAQHGAQEANLLVLLDDGRLELSHLLRGRLEVVFDPLVTADLPMVRHLLLGAHEGAAKLVVVALA